MIDSHQHFWTTSRNDYGWLAPDDTVLYRDFGPEDLTPLIAPRGIEQTVLVQAAPTVEETLYLLDIAQRTVVDGEIIHHAPEISTYRIGPANSKRCPRGDHDTNRHDRIDKHTVDI